MASGTSPITASSLLKLANHAMHGGETLYASVFQRFHDNHEQKIARHLVLLHFSNLHTMQCMEVKLGTYLYFSVSMTTMKWPQALFPVTTSSLLKLAHHTGEIHSQVYLSISMMATSLRHSISYFIGACSHSMIYTKCIERRQVNKKS